MRMRKGTAGRHAILALVMSSVVCPSPAEDDGIPWLSNYQEAIQEAKRTQKPVFLEFRCEP